MHGGAPSLPVYSHIAGIPFFVHAWLFVDFFFVLSGFVIAASYGERLVKGFGVERFMLLRLGRLYPVHIVVLAVYVAYELLTSAIRHLAPFSEPSKSLDTISPISR
jgi:peptidoglycan/LPS O-acetylase OafA/YrhL